MNIYYSWPLPSALSQSFKHFSQLPPAVQQMIWKEFYLTPRYFAAKWTMWSVDYGADGSSEDSKTEDFNSDTSDHVADDVSIHSECEDYAWADGWKIEPFTSSKAIYYDDIDNNINQTSRSVAHRLRPQLQLPVRCSPTEGRSISWSTTSSHGRDSKDPFVNFKSDFFYFGQHWPMPHEMRDRQCFEWLDHVQNIIIDTEITLGIGSEDEVASEIMKGFTKDNIQLWEMRPHLPNLKVVRRRLTDKAPRLLNEWAYFQTRYLLSKVGAINHDIAKDSNWLPGTFSPKEPQWKPFVNKLLSSGAAIRSAISKDLTLEDDEILGSKKLFSSLALIPKVV